MKKKKNNEKALSRAFLLKRGHCCKSGCLNCPYGFEEDPETPQELNFSEDDIEKYLELGDEECCEE